MAVVWGVTKKRTETTLDLPSGGASSISTILGLDRNSSSISPPSGIRAILR